MIYIINHSEPVCQLTYKCLLQIMYSFAYAANQLICMCLAICEGFNSSLDAAAVSECPFTCSPHQCGRIGVSSMQQPLLQRTSETEQDLLV